MCYFSLGQKEMRSVSSQTEGTVTIINVGQPVYPSNVVGVRHQSNSTRSSQQSLARSSRLGLNSCSYVISSSQHECTTIVYYSNALTNITLHLSE